MTTLAEPRDARFVVACPGCHGQVSATWALAGQAARCPLCAAAMLVPVPPAASTGPAAAELVFREPVLTVGRGANLVELRRLSPEELRIRRGRRNLLMLAAGVALLIVIVLLFSKPH